MNHAGGSNVSSGHFWTQSGAHNDNDDTSTMVSPIVGDADGISDYGSDFTPDEEEILNGLLHPEQQDTLEDLDAGLCVKDIEDEESPRGAKVRRLVLEQQHQPLPQIALSDEKKRIDIQIDGDSANSMPPSPSHYSS